MPLQVPTAVYRIETPRMVIRCYNPVDAHLLIESIKQSLEHLKLWMPWANNEPEPLLTKILRIRKTRAYFDLDEEYTYGIFTPNENFLIGSIALRPTVGPKAIEIGYWINVNYINKGYCTEAAGALTKIAFEILGFKRVEIHCDPKNLASAAIPKKLNYIHEATLKKRVLNEKNELRDSMIWSIIEAEYQQSLSKNSDVKAYDAIGSRIY